MQTPAERCLIENVIASLPFSNGKKLSTALNIGAGRSLVIERAITEKVRALIYDRVDAKLHRVRHPNVRRQYEASVESMNMVPSNAYNAAFANYVLEHVPDIDKAAKEIYRVLKKDGCFIASVPNPQAPEFLISRITPKWFHQLVKGKGEGKEAFETIYAYKNIRTLNRMFEHAGFETVAVKRYSFVLGYLYRFPVLHTLGRIYDAIVNALHLIPLMGHACVTYRKTS
jgi:ubiquinone/menaquinone biosynthesis C-methylase UbiE